MIRHPRPGRCAVALLLICCSTTAIVQAQSDPWTLESLLESLAVRNHQLIASGLTELAIERTSDQVGALPDPMISVVYQPLPVHTARGVQSVQIRAEQQFPFPGTLSLREDEAALNRRLAESQTEGLSLDLERRVKELYFEAVSAQRKRDLIVSFQERMADFEGIAGRRYAVGLENQSAILKAQLEKNALETGLLRMMEATRVARARLASLLDLDYEGMDLSGTMYQDESTTLVALDRFIAASMIHRPEVRGASLAISSAAVRADLARKAFYPGFAVSVSWFGVSRSDIPPAADGRDAFGIGVSVRVPLSRSPRRARSEQTRIEINRAEHQKLQLDDTILAEVQRSWHGAELRSQVLMTLSTAVIPQAETVVERLLNAYGSGLADFLELLDAERRLFGAKLEFEDALFNYRQSVADLERAVGVRSLASLIAPESEEVRE